MEEPVEIYVRLSPEVQEVLADNQLSLVDLLRQQGLEVESRLGEDPAATATGAKEPVTVILASAVLVAALTPVIVKVISALSHKQAFVTERQLVVATDATGAVVRDAAGNPIHGWVDRARFVETEAPAPESAKASGSAEPGGKIQFEVGVDRGAAKE